jgi:CRP-like cAMP-binding protein
VEELQDSYLDILCANDFMTRASAEKLLQLGEVLKLDRRDTFVTIGDQRPVMGIVLRGLMKMFYLKNDKPINIFLIPEQAVVSNFDMLFKSQPSNQEIECIEETDLLLLDYEAVLKKQKEDVDFCFDMYNMVLRQLLDSLYRIESFLLLNATERLERFLDEQPELAQRIPLNVLASFIGVSEVHVSRIRSKKYKKKPLSNH